MRANRMVLLAAMAAAIVTALGQEASAQSEDALQLRVYDVGDLVMEVRDYEYPGSEFGTKKTQSPGFVGGGGGGGGGGFGGGGGGGVFQFGGGGSGGGRSSTTATSTTTEDLLNVLYGVVATDTWKENGGGDADARMFGNSLVVSQTPEVHAQIEQLLQQLREGAGERKSITVDARWLLLGSDELDQLYVKKNGAQQFNHGVPTLDREKLAEFTRRPTSIRAVTSCFSGQLVYVVSGTKRNVVSGYIPVVGSLEDGNSAAQLASSRGRSVFRLVSEGGDSAVGYQPIVEQQNIGALLEIRPTLVQGNKEAIVDLKVTVTDSADSLEGVQPVGAGPPEVDRIALQSQELATTLRVPLGEPVLVGGMTNVSISAMESNESPQLYMVLELR